ncbi:MAG: hypothetical protein O8C67_10830 [Candidatus Methanoperedens sp.]|nr:hypothetical protein [Candidatus Methanoperedens sp.]
MEEDYLDYSKTVDKEISQKRKSQFLTFLSWLREVIIYIIFWIITAIAAFEAGMIYEFKGFDNNNKRLTKMEVTIGEMAGKVTSHDAILQRFKTPSRKD